jgi:hypothetical protein
MEQRQEPRTAHKIRLFVHVHDCEEDPDLVGVTIACETVDLSTHGLQLKTNLELTTGTLLNITIGIGDPFAMYLLRGELRWIRPDGDDYCMGVLLKEAGDTDFDKWIEFSATIAT